jgi:ribosomal protein S8E
MPQNEYIERFTKQHGRRLDWEERKRKRAAREGHKASENAQVSAIPSGVHDGWGRPQPDTW